MTLSRDEIMAMSANELRVAIAKKHGCLTVNPRTWRGLIVLNEGCPSDNIPDEYGCTTIPDYPHDIAEAWELVEDWHDKGEVESIDYVASDGIRSMVYSCSLRHSHIYATAPTAPLAICRAWLIWSEESEG